MVGLLAERQYRDTHRQTLRAPVPGRGHLQLGSLEALEEVHSEQLPETTTFQTGRGGMRLVFRYPADGPPIRISAGQLGRGLDVRGEGGDVVVPPSCTEGLYELLERRP
jgi:Bifunctional DNA primase/polymerase, N-terminal